MGRISYRIRRKIVEAHREVLETDTRTYSSIENTIRTYMKRVPCPLCGNARMVGLGLTFYVAQTHLFRQIDAKSIFGRAIKRDQPIATVFNLSEAQFAVRWNNKWGYLKCRARGCGFYTGVKDDDLEREDWIANRYLVIHQINRTLDQLVQRRAVEDWHRKPDKRRKKMRMTW